MRLRVEALGGLTVLGAHGAVLPIPGSCRAVLGYLLTHRRRPVTRTELAETVWAEHDGNHARRCLSTALWRLKKSAGPAPVITFAGAEEVSFNWHAPAWVDAVAMELRIEPLLRLAPSALSRAQIARLQRGVRLYRGDYLIGINQEWAWLERQRLRNLYLDGLYHLTLACAAAADWPRVLEWGRRLNRDEPLREDVHRLLMRAHAQTGNRALAIAQYQSCRDLLRADLGVGPMPETQELYHAIATATPQAEPVTGPATAPAPRTQPQTPLARAQRRVARVRRALVASEKQLAEVLATLRAAPSES